MKKLALTAGAVLALSVLTAPAAFAAEPADCGAATAALTTAQNEHRDAVADDEKAEKAKDADRDFDRADRDFDRAKKRLDDALKANDDNQNNTPEQDAEIASAQKNFDQATRERDRARDKADKENADQLQRAADRTDADELKKAVDEAQDDVNRLCGGVTTTPPADDPADVDCDEVSASEAQRILDGDRNDPNDLDADGDGIACEVDEILDPPADNPVTINNNVAVPQGGVSTGVGPRDS